MLLMELNTKIKALASSLRMQYDQIDFDRKVQLIDLSEIVTQELNFHKSVDLNFICTHNSRRSQLAQVWVKAAASYFNIKNIYAYSGGTEATAFNHRMVNALMEEGFEIEQLDDSENPKYKLELSDNNNQNIYFSKKYDHEVNPQSGSLAIMVCDSANEACPVVQGAKEKYSLTYKDPKAFDDSPKESKMYIDKVHEIGREILFLMENTAAIINV